MLLEIGPNQTRPLRAKTRRNEKGEVPAVLRLRRPGCSERDKIARPVVYARSPRSKLNHYRTTHGGIKHRTDVQGDRKSRNNRGGPDFALPSRMRVLGDTSKKKRLDGRRDVRKRSFFPYRTGVLGSPVTFLFSPSFQRPSLRKTSMR